MPHMSQLSGVSSSRPELGWGPTQQGAQGCQDGGPLSDYTGVKDRGGGPLLGTPPLFLRVTRFCNVWTDAALSRALGMTPWVGTLEHPGVPPEAASAPLQARCGRFQVYSYACIFQADWSAYTQRNSPYIQLDAPRFSRGTGLGWANLLFPFPHLPQISFHAPSFTRSEMGIFSCSHFSDVSVVWEPYNRGVLGVSWAVCSQ